MSSTLNLEAMRKEDLHFVTRLSAATLREVNCSTAPGCAASVVASHQADRTDRGKRYVIAGGEHRQQRDLARRRARLEKSERELKRLAAVRRKKPNPQKLASHVGRRLQQLKAHKYFPYWVR